MISREGSHYVLRSKKTGKVLGRHESRASAEAQERAIQAAKHARSDERLSPIELRRRVMAASKAKRRRVDIARPVPPNGIASTYASTLRALSREMDDAITAALMQARLVNDSADFVRMDGPPADGHVPDYDGDDIERLVREITARLGEIGSRKALVGRIERIANRTITHSRDQWRAQLRDALGVDLTADPNLAPMIERFRKRQGSMIRSLAADKIARVKRVLRDSRGDRVEQITQRIQNETSATASRAELIARTEVSSFHANVMQARHEAAGIHEFVWSCSLDERTRPTHRALESKVFRYDDPPLIPGEGAVLPGAIWNCRCVAVPRLPEIQ